MEIWTFIFPSDLQPWASLRIAAADKTEAQILAQTIEPPAILIPADNPNRPHQFADGSFMQPGGLIDGEPRVLHAIARVGA